MAAPVNVLLGLQGHRDRGGYLDIQGKAIVSIEYIVCVV